jgi:hypothetical protein
MRTFASVLFLTALLSTVIYSQHAHHAAPATEPPESEKTELIDEFGRLGHCDMTSRFDNFFQQLSQNPVSVGYVIVYQGTDVLPASYDSPGMGRMFVNHMYFRNFDSSRVVVINGGFRTEAGAELWIVHPGGEEPAPKDTVPAPVMPEGETFLFDKGYFYSDEMSSSLEDFELPSFKARRAAEEAAWAGENEAENPGDEEASETPADVEEPTEEDPEPDASAEPEEEYVDTRTPEEIEEERFSFISDKFGKLLAKRIDSTGVIILYADDQTYDIGRLMSFVEEGKVRLCKLTGIDPVRVSIRFGGYRDSPEVDHWIVPPSGKGPVATPAERPVEQPEEPLD